MSKKADKTTGSKDDSDELPPMEPVPPPGRVSSSDVPASTPAPRAARFGEGKEGRGERRERGVSGPRAGFFERTGQFLHDVRAEMQRVAWPTRTEVRNTTIITIIAVIFFAIYLKVVDEAFTFLITQLERFVNWLFGVV
jgi:preprotein translocase subunit SecE